MSALIRGYESAPTSPTLLRRVRDWSDSDAWFDFVGRYRRMVLRWCREAGLGAEAADEVWQRVLVRLANKMRSFCYDPSRSFRSWLCVLVRREVINYRREAARSPSGLEVDDRAFEDHVRAFKARAADDEPGPHPLLEKARQVHDAVKAHVTEKSWRCFWESDIDGTPLADVAKLLEMNYHAAFAARDRVRRRLIEEGKRLS